MPNDINQMLAAILGNNNAGMPPVAQEATRGAALDAAAPQDDGGGLRGDLISMLVQLSQGGGDLQAPQVPMPERANKYQRIGAILSGIGGDPSFAHRIASEPDRMQQAATQNAMLAGQTEQANRQMRMNAAGQLVGIGEKALDRGLQASTAEMRSRDAAADRRERMIQFIAREEGIDRRHAETIAQRAEQFGITNERDWERIYNERDRIDIERQRLTAQEKNAVKAANADNERAIRSLMARYPNAFPADFTPEGRTFVEAVKAVADSGLALKSHEIPAYILKDFGNMRASIKGITEAVDLYNKLGQPSGWWTGVKRTAGSAVGSPTSQLNSEEKAYNAALEGAIAEIRRYLFGTAVTPGERQETLALLPSMWSDPESMLNGLTQIRAMIERKHAEYTKLFGDPDGASTSTEYNIIDEIP